MNLLRAFTYCSIFLVCCSEPEAPGKTIILGENMDIPADRVFLTNTDEKPRILDTAKVIGGTFTFNLADEYEPFRAYIVYLNSNGRYSMVYFIDDSQNSIPYSEFFVVEPGLTHILGRDKSGYQSAFASVQSGEENKLIFNPGYWNLGFVDNTSEATYKHTLARVKEHINAYPDSYLLLESVYESRGNYFKEDLAAVLASAGKKVSNSVSAINIQSYLDALPDNYNPLQAMPLLNRNNGFVTDYDRKEKLNMLIVTHSWFYPSILLMFYMNRDKEAFDIEDLAIVDIGAEEIEEWWTDKVDQSGDVAWDQLYVPVKRRSLFFNLHGLNKGFPLIIFTNEQGKEIKRFYPNKFDKFSTEEKMAYLNQLKVFISDYLKNH